MEITSINNTALQAATPAASPAPEKPAVQRELIHAVKAVQTSALFGQDAELTFVVDRETRRTLVRVVDRQTGDVILQTPPEYLLEMAKDFDALARRQSGSGGSDLTG
jgi:uncharacterized FlaG/YvyC family protein